MTAKQSFYAEVNHSTDDKMKIFKISNKKIGLPVNLLNVCSTLKTKYCKWHSSCALYPNWGRRFRASHPEVFHKKGVLKRFAKFKGKQLCWNLF